MSNSPSGDQPGPRSREQRKADVIRMLHAQHADVWVASATAAGVAHLVPLSFAWTRDRVMLVTPADSATARNVVRAGTARLALGGTRDVVMIDAHLEMMTPLADASSDLADAYAKQADWDPRAVDGDFAVLVLGPHRIQAWREADEIPGRTVMRGGRWLD
jgi:hypothetical protein